VTATDSCMRTNPRSTRQEPHVRYTLVHQELEASYTSTLKASHTSSLRPHTLVAEDAMAGLSEASRTCCFSSTHLAQLELLQLCCSSIAALLQLSGHAALARLTYALVLQECIARAVAALLQLCCSSVAALQTCCFSERHVCF
jgi:hypothetical protein